MKVLLAWLAAIVVSRPGMRRTGRPPATSGPLRAFCPGMRRTGSWLREQGAQVVLAIEDPNTGHGALQLDPRNAARMLELLSR